MFPKLVEITLAAALLLTGCGALPGQVVSPPDTYRDVAARTLIERARRARDLEVEGIQSYEGILRERIYVGITALAFRRERGLFEQERVARLRWSSDGERAIQWLGARRAVPIVGADTGRDPPGDSGRVGGAGVTTRDDLRSELPRDLLGESGVPAFPFDPGGDRLAFGNNWALHPLSDSADAHYRFSSGDTIRIRIPTEEREVVLYEVKVEPRRADFHLVAGSLWFESERASLVRASYRPARPFDLLLDQPEDADEVPALLQPVQAEIAYVTVEYSLNDLRFWLPRRFALEGEARLGRIVRIPLTVEWSVGDYRVNEATTEIPLTGPLPPGWSRRQESVEGDDGTTSYVTVVVPVAEALMASPELSADFGQRALTAFTDEEIDDMRSELEALLPTWQAYRPRFAWGLERGLLRFNRVEGLSVGATATVPLAPSASFELEARVGTGDQEPNVSATLLRGAEDRRWAVSAYNRLRPMADVGNPFSIASSVTNLVLGTDRAEYFRTSGAAIGYRRIGKRVRWEVEGFYERQRPVSLGTDFFLLEALGDKSVHGVLAADSLDIGGGRGTLTWFSGVDPNAWIVTGQLRAEAAGGDASYHRAAASLSVGHPLPLGLAGALEVGGGAIWGDEPVQRSFFLGGGATLRGFDHGALRGPAFWRGRAELASGFPGARIGLFADAGWAGSRSVFSFHDPAVAVGLGTSLLDGIMRFDIARSVRKAQSWKVHIYLDGLF